MQNVRQFVSASGSTTLKGLFASEACDFDPPSNSLRQNVKKFRAKEVYDLASGATGDPEEDKIRDLMAGADNSYELIRMFGAIDGWPGLDDELPEGHLDPIARQLAQVLDQRDYVPYQLLRRYTILLDYNAAPTLDSCFLKLLFDMPKEFQADEFDGVLAKKPLLLKTVTGAAMRNRVNMVAAARIMPFTVNQYIAGPVPRQGELVALLHEIDYTLRFCVPLALLDYQPLYAVLADMVSPLPNPQRIACRDTCLRLEKEFAAAAKAVNVVGSNAAKGTVNRFMLARKAALDNFPAAVPAPGAIAAIAAAIGGVASTVADLLTVVSNLPDALAGAITLPNLTGSGEDDQARFLISELHSQGTLAHLDSDSKTKLVNALLSGFTDDDDELAIIRVYETTKAHCLAELYQLAAAATWESLYTSFDGDEYDTLESVLDNPS